MNSFVILYRGLDKFAISGIYCNLYMVLYMLLRVKGSLNCRNSDYLWLSELHRRKNCNRDLSTPLLKIKLKMFENALNEMRLPYQHKSIWWMNMRIVILFNFWIKPGQPFWRSEPHKKLAFLSRAKIWILSDDSKHLFNTPPAQLKKFNWQKHKMYIIESCRFLCIFTKFDVRVHIDWRTRFKASSHNLTI